MHVCVFEMDGIRGRGYLVFLYYNLYTYDISVPGPHIASRKTPEKIEKNLHRGKSEEPFRRATEEDPSLQDGQKNRCHVTGRTIDVM